jgi:hypothetical protein
MDKAFLICSIVFNMYGYDINNHDVTFDNCTDVTYQGIDRGYNGSVIAGLTFYESRYDRREVNKTSKARGIFQVLSSWHCPSKSWKNCDPIEAGFRAIFKSYKYTAIKKFNKESTVDRMIYIDKNRTLLSTVIGWYTGVKASGKYNHVNMIVDLIFKINRHIDCRCSI